MSRRRQRHQQQRSTNAPKWMLVEVHAICAEENHPIHRGKWGLFWPFRYDRPRMVLCETHAHAQGYERHERPFSMVEDADDRRARQVGGEK